MDRNISSIYRPDPELSPWGQNWLTFPWNTIYIRCIQQHLAASETPLTDEAIRHTSPTIRAHLNVYGRYDLHAIKTPRNGQYRPLRNT